MLGLMRQLGLISTATQPMVQQFMWPVRFPDLKKLANRYAYIQNIPKPASDIIVERMNLKNLPNDWKEFVSQIWPARTLVDMQTKFKQKMESVLALLGTKCEETANALNLLEKMERMDVLMELENFSK